MYPFIVELNIKLNKLMTTIKVIYRASSKDSGDGSLFYRIIHKRKMRQVNTGYKIARNEWNDESECIVVDGSAVRAEFLKSVQLNLQLGKTRMTRIISSLEKSGNEFSVDEVVEKFKEPDTIVGFMSFARNLISGLKQMGKKRCAEHYTTAINSFIRFNGDVEVPFEEFDGTLMQKYECYLKDMNLISNSISYYMRNLRAIYNKAVEKGLTKQSNPFRHVYTGIAKTVKRAVSLQTIKDMRSIDLRNNPQSEFARDLFLFSFYTRGMTIVDMAYLKKSNLKDGVLTYRRRKTGQRLSIRWEPQMQEIAYKYSSSDSDFLFPIIDSCRPDFQRQYLTAYTRLKRHLNNIGKKLGLTEPLTFHRSRHAWASIARDNNVPLSVICEGMGHDSEKTTRIYLASLDTSVVDKANRNIMKLLEK